VSPSTAALYSHHGGGEIIMRTPTTALGLRIAAIATFFVISCSSARPSILTAPGDNITRPTGAELLDSNATQLRSDGAADGAADGRATSWAGISSYYLWSCNATVRAEALNAVRVGTIPIVTLEKRLLKY
jgi:hypothetical protein